MIEDRFNGRLVPLKFNLWEFENVLPRIDLNFTEHLTLIPSEDMFTNDMVAKVIYSKAFPVRLYSSKYPVIENEYLAINVVNPASVEDIHIEVTMED